MITNGSSCFGRRSSSSLSSMSFHESPKLVSLSLPRGPRSRCFCWAKQVRISKLPSLIGRTPRRVVGCWSSSIATHHSKPVVCVASFLARSGVLLKDSLNVRLAIGQQQLLTCAPTKDPLVDFIMTFCKCRSIVACRQSSSQSREYSPNLASRSSHRQLVMQRLSMS